MYQIYAEQKNSFLGHQTETIEGHKGKVYSHNSSVHENYPNKMEKTTRLVGPNGSR